MIKISVIFHDEEFVIVTFSDVVIVFKVRETLADLLFGVQPVQPVIGLYPQYVLFGFHDMVDQISRKQCFWRIDWGIYLYAGAIENIQTVTWTNPDDSLMILVKR